jgi:hypothetical protein
MTVVRAIAAFRGANEIGWRIKPHGRIEQIPYPADERGS